MNKLLIAFQMLLLVFLVGCTNEAEYVGELQNGKPHGKGSMYVRPITFGITPSISVGPAVDYLFMVFGSPVGSYFKDGVKPLHLLISNEYHRAAPKGIGNAKALGNF